MEQRGLFQKAGTDGIWYVRKVIPADFRGHFGGKTAFVESTGTRNIKAARADRDHLFRKWEGLIAEAKRLGKGDVADLPAVQVALDNWRRAQCGAAADLAAALEAERVERDKAGVLETIAWAGTGQESQPMFSMRRPFAVVVSIPSWSSARKPTCRALSSLTMLLRSPNERARRSIPMLDITDLNRAARAALTRRDPPTILATLAASLERDAPHAPEGQKAEALALAHAIRAALTTPRDPLAGKCFLGGTVVSA